MRWARRGRSRVLGPTNRPDEALIPEREKKWIFTGTPPRSALVGDEDDRHLCAGDNSKDSQSIDGDEENEDIGDRVASLEMAVHKSRSTSNTVRKLIEITPKKNG